MDLTLLDSLLAVADEGTITAAAERLHLSQPALSRRIQQLEADLGARLLVRGRHGIELTQPGRLAVEQGRRIVSGYGRLRRDIAEHIGLLGGSVRIGGGATATSYVLPPAIAEFQSAHPGVRFHVKEAASLEIATDVASGSIELGVVTIPVPTRELDLEDLLVDEIVPVARPGHPLHTGRARAADLEGQSFIGFESGSAIRQIIDSGLRAAGVDVEVTMELRSIPSIVRMVATTGSLAFVSSTALHSEPHVQAIPIRGLRITRTLALATRRGFPLSAPADGFAGAAPSSHDLNRRLRSRLEVRRSVRRHPG